jgi:L-Ala-D/L-Glu epimerase
MSIKIERVEVFGVAMPLVGNFASAKGPKSIQKSAVVRITGTGGVVGIGSVEPILNATWTETTEEVILILNEKLAPAIIGNDPTNINQLRSVLEALSPRISNARVPIEIACVDLSSRSFGVPIHTYLGGAVTDHLEFNAWIGLLPAHEAATEAVRWFKRGFRSAKIKVSGDVKADYERIAAVRRAVGGAMQLRIDANESYEASTSIALAKRVREFSIEHFEQPAPSGDLEGLARVRRDGGIPVMADESITDHASLISVIKAEAADVVKLGIKEQGSFQAVAHLMATAEAAGMRCVVGHGFGLAPSTLAEIALAATSRNVIPGLECVGPLKTSDTITTTKLDLSSGSLALSRSLGLGIELDNEKLQQYTLED